MQNWKQLAVNWADQGSWNRTAPPSAGKNAKKGWKRTPQQRRAAWDTARGAGLVTAGLLVEDAGRKLCDRDWWAAGCESCREPLDCLAEPVPVQREDSTTRVKDGAVSWA